MRAAEGCQTGNRNPDRNLRFFLSVTGGPQVIATGASLRGLSARQEIGAPQAKAGFCRRMARAVTRSEKAGYGAAGVAGAGIDRLFSTPPQNA